MGNEVSVVGRDVRDQIWAWMESEELGKLRKENEMLKQKLQGKENFETNNPTSEISSKTIHSSMTGPSMADLDRAAIKPSPTVIKRPVEEWER